MSNIIDISRNKNINQRILNKAHVDNLRAQEPSCVRFPLVVRDLYARQTENPLSKVFSQFEDSYFELKTPTKALFNGNTGQEIGLVGARRQDALSSYGEYLDTVYDVLERCDVNLEGVEGKFTLGPDTGSLLGRWRIPNERFEAPCGDDIIPEIGMTTSLNGRFPFQLGLGCIKIWCDNGMTLFNSTAMLYHHKHDGRLDVQVAAEMLSQTIRSISKEQELWRKLSNTPVDKEKVWRVIHGMVNGTSAEFDIKAVMSEAFGGKHKRLSYLRKAWASYRARLGINEWALFNLVTDYYTHYPSKSRDVVKLSQSRAAKSKEIIEEYLLAA